MESSNKKTHAHKRSNSLYEEQDALTKQEQISFVSDIQTKLTMKLLEESQIKSQFQIIVDFLHPEDNLNRTQSIFKDIMNKNEKDVQFQEILKEYFQIQSINFMKKTSQKPDKVFNSELDLERLENDSKANSRLRYHRNKKSKVFNTLDLHKDFSFNFSEKNWDQNYHTMNPCAKA